MTPSSSGDRSGLAQFISIRKEKSLQSFALKFDPRLFVGCSENICGVEINKFIIEMKAENCINKKDIIQSHVGLLIVLDKLEITSPPI